MYVEGTQKRHAATRERSRYVQVRRNDLKIGRDQKQSMPQEKGQNYYKYTLSQYLFSKKLD